MSVLASITVYQCDKCGAILMVKDANSAKFFELMWHQGLAYDFCQQCKYTEFAKSKIEIENQAIKRRQTHLRGRR